MIKYFIPTNVKWNIVEVIRELNFKNDLLKTINEFNDTNIKIDKKLKYEIIKLELLIHKEMYSSDLEKKCKSLISAFENSGNIITINDDLEWLLLYAIICECVNLDLLINNEKNKMMYPEYINEKINFEALKLIQQVSDTCKLEDLLIECESKLEEFRPITWFKKDILNVVDMKKVKLIVNGKYMFIDTETELITFNKGSVSVKFKNGEYRFGVNEIYPSITPICKQKFYWKYEIGDYAFLFYQK